MVEQTLSCTQLPSGTMLLHRFSVKPRHLDDYLEIWPREVRVRWRHGYTVHRAFVETDAEPKFTWLYSHPDPYAGQSALHADPEAAEVDKLKANHVFRNVKIRPVRAEVLTDPDPARMAERIAIMRRYSITGSWSEFLNIWRRIVPVREKYGFHCLFAVADEPEDMFTWAFDFAGPFDDFAAAQRPYYRDPQRVALREVFDYMADYTIHPARQLPIPAPPPPDEGSPC